MNILLTLATYVAKKLEKVLGVDVFYYDMPDSPDECICLQEKKTSLPTLPQIDAVCRRIVVSVRAKSNERAYALANEVYQWMWCSDADEESPTGFLEIAEGLFVFSDVRGMPVWDKSDQKGRKYFTFETVVTTQKL